MSEPGQAPIWHKGIRAADWVTRFTVGDDPVWDTLLLPFDCIASEAHAWGLAQIGVLTGAEHAQIASELAKIQAEHAAGRIVVETADEDCHTVIERRLTETLGDVGRKIHTGRSRNDQVLTALRLWLRDHLAATGRKTARLAEILCALGADGEDVVMPGYTHMQRAMPSTVGLWALGYAELLVSDLAGLGETAARIDLSPLGSAAGYGVPYLELPREAVARRMGFKGVQLHATSVQLSRGKFEAEAVHALVQIAATVNRLASDLVLFSTAEFAFVHLPDAFTTGSSIMPQKRNPDVLELARATFHRLAAELQVLLAIPANLMSGYHRDLQPTKAAVMSALLTTEDLLDAMIAVLGGLEFDEARLKAAMSADLYATAAALKRVAGGEPFRDAYRSAAVDVSAWETEGGRSVHETYRTTGSPGRTDPGAVLGQLRRASAWLQPPPTEEQARQR